MTPARNRDPISVYDSIEVSAIPRGALVVAGYVDGRWPTYRELLEQRRGALHISLATSWENDADVLDVERGDATVEEAIAWIRRRHTAGVKRPALYMSLSEAELFAEDAQQAGIRRGQYRLWTAHWTDAEHICGPACGLHSERPGCTQWMNNAAADYDRSLTTWGWARAVAYSDVPF